jgi:hypothetical protein
MNSTILWGVRPCSLVMFFFIACLTYTSMLQMDAVRSSEISVNFYQTKRLHIPEDNTVHNHILVLHSVKYLSYVNKVCIVLAQLV